MVRRNGLRWALLLIGLSMAASGAGAVTAIPPAVYTDPPHDALYPARSQILHIPTGGMEINGIAYLAAGAGAHPTRGILRGPAG